MRLTVKKNDKYNIAYENNKGASLKYFSTATEEVKQIIDKCNNIFQKLGQLEDIEEELGIDLKVYHRIMNMLYCGEPKNNVYIKEGNSIIEVHILEIDYCKKKIIFYKDNYEDEYVYGFYQYGEQWALTKEELR